jgi:hypothetical protein
LTPMARSSTARRGLGRMDDDSRDLAVPSSSPRGRFLFAGSSRSWRNTTCEGRYNALAPACVDLLIAVAPHDSGGFPGVGLGDSGVAVIVAGRLERKDEASSQIHAGLGFGKIDGYFSVRRDDAVTTSDSFQPRRSHAQTTSGDVQPGPGPAPDRDRSNGFSLELPLVRIRIDRSRTHVRAPATEIARHADVFFVWSDGPLYCGRSVIVGQLTGSIVRARALGRHRVRELFSFARDPRWARVFPIGEASTSFDRFRSTRFAR